MLIKITQWLIEKMGRLMNIDDELERLKREKRLAEYAYVISCISLIVVAIVSMVV
jgi:hypothetical protein